MLSAFVEMLEGKRRLRECYLDDYVKNVRAKAKMSGETRRCNTQPDPLDRFRSPLFLRQKVSMSDFLKAGRKKIAWARTSMSDFI